MFLNSAPYRVVGGNNYYLGYVEEPTQNAVLDLVTAFGMNTLRIWAFYDAASAPGANEVCLQYWDSQKNLPVINAGANGFDRLDRAVAKAAQRGIRLIMTLTNYWSDFGGIPQYIEWFGLDPADKDVFYTDDRCRLAYRDWVRQIVTRYRDNPAVLAWELANEPRCSKGIGTLLAWVNEMSAFVRELDPNHFVAVGDEGYFHHHLAFGNSLYNGQFGVSCEELLGIGTIDFGTVHMYPESMAKGKDPVAFGEMWIRDHIEAGQRADKPMLVEEYGLQDPESRNSVFDAWLRTVEELNGMGSMLWMAGLDKGEGQPYAPDRYVISSVDAAPAIRAHAARMFGGGTVGAQAR